MTFDQAVSFIDIFSSHPLDRDPRPKHETLRPKLIGSPDFAATMLDLPSTGLVCSGTHDARAENVRPQTHQDRHLEH